MDQVEERERERRERKREKEIIKNNVYRRKKSLIGVICKEFDAPGNIVSNISWMKSGGSHVSTSCYLNPGLLYSMHTLRFYMILIHDKQNPLTTSNYILYAPKPPCNIQHAKIHEITMT